MGYIDVIIPLVAGVTFTMAPDVLIKPTDTNFEKKKSLIKKGGLVLIGVSILYFLIKIFG